MRSTNYKDAPIGLSLLANAKEIKIENNGKKRCRWENCLTKLNRYNPNEYCHSHAFRGAVRDDLVQEAEVRRIATVERKRKKRIRLKHKKIPT